MNFTDLERRLHPAEELRRGDWHRHKRGGGWIENSAVVAATAYIGPYAIVLRRAHVLDEAEIRDDTIVTAGAIVAGRVYAGGKSRIGDLAKISGTARIIDADVGGYAVIAEGLLTGTVYRPRSLQAWKTWKAAILVR